MKDNELLVKCLGLIKKYNVTAYEIEKNTRLSAVGVQKIIDGVTKRPQSPTLDTIISYITNEYESDITSEIVNDTNTTKDNYLDNFKIIEDINEIPEQFRHWVKPFYPEMKVGAGMELGHYRQTSKYFILVPGSERVEFWVPVEGYSMFPKYNHNDLVGLTEIHYDGVFPGHNYVVSYKTGSAHLKKIVKSEDPNKLILRSYNPDFGDKEELIEKLHKFFKVQMYIGNE